MIGRPPRVDEGNQQPDGQASDILHQKATIHYGAELIRKGIHLCSLSIPIVYYHISRESALFILLPVTAAFFITDIARYTIPAVSAWYYRTFGMLLRQHEQDHKTRRLTGATNILLSAVVCVALLPKIITVNAFAILIISDTTSALVGRRFGTRRFLGKSLEGTLAFFLSALLVVLIAPKATGTPVEYFLWIAGAAAGALAEASLTRVDDNISVPLTVGLVVWGLYWLFLPGVNLYS